MNLEPPNLIYAIDYLFVKINGILIKLDRIFRIINEDNYIFVYKYYMHMIDLKILKKNWNISTTTTHRTNFNLFMDTYIYNISSNGYLSYHKLISNKSHFHKLLYSMSITRFMIYDFPSYNKAVWGIIPSYNTRAIY